MVRARRGLVKRQSLSFSPGALVILLMAGEWILLVAGTHPHEMIVGALSISAACAFLSFAYRSSNLHVRFRAADVAAVWRLPGYVALDTWVVVRVLFQDLFLMRQAPSLYRVCCLASSKDEPEYTGRCVLATIYSTASPNTIVIGIDSEQNRMLFHQVQRNELSKMDRTLGCRPCKSG